MAVVPDLRGVLKPPEPPAGHTPGHCMTIAFIHFVALPLSTIMDQLAPVEFSS